MLLLEGFFEREMGLSSETGSLYLRLVESGDGNYFSMKIIASQKGGG